MKASKLIKELQEKIAKYGDLEVTNSFDAVIEGVVVNEGSTEDYFTLDDNNYDIIDVQNGIYD